MKSHQVHQASANLIEMQEQINIGCFDDNLSYFSKNICLRHIVTYGARVKLQSMKVRGRWAFLLSKYFVIRALPFKGKHW